jgi:hypothetical protein
MPWKSRPTDLLATRGDRGGIIKTKDQIVANMKLEEHVNYVHQRLLPLTSPPRRRVRLSPPQPLGDLDPWLYSLLNSTHHLLSSTNPTLDEDCWLHLPPCLPQVLATPMDTLEALPGNKLDLPLMRPDITNVKLTHLVLQCLQSLQRSTPLGEISKSLCINIKESTNNTQCCPLLELILFVELLPMFVYLTVGRESILSPS